MSTPSTSNRRLRSLLLALIFIVPCAAAQEMTFADTSNSPRRSSLGNHVFSPSYFQADPFIHTYFRNSLGFGATPNFEIPLVQIDGEQYSWSSGQLLFALMRFEFRGALRNWLAVDMQVDVVGRLANETVPLLSQGVVLVSDFELGALIEVYRSTDMTCALSVGATSLGVTDVDIQRFITALKDSGEITPDDALVTSTPSVQAFVDARAAYAFNDLFGLTAHARILYGEATERPSADQWFTMFGLMLDINPSQRWGAPVGFGIGIKTDTNPRGGNETGKRMTTFFGRVGYLGAKDFDLGLDIAFTRVPLPSLPEKHAFLSAVIDMKLNF